MSNEPRGSMKACELTIREWTAIEALGGMLACPGESAIYREELAKDAIRYADLLIELLDCTKPPKDDKPPVPCDTTPPETVDWRDVNICMLFNEGPHPLYAFLRSCGISTCVQLNDMVCGGAEGFAYLSCEAHQELRTLLARYQTKCGVKR